jgi:DNA-binding LacI/PurR family transcriptional regulator
VSHPFWGSAFLGAESQAVERGYSLLLGNTLNDRAGHVTHVESRLLEVMLDKRVDGIILMGGRVNEARPIPEHRDEVRRVLSQVPVVTCGRMKGLGCWTVEIDEPHGIALAVDHLVSLGHRRLGFLGGMRGIEPTDTRIAAFGASLEDHGLPFEPAWCIESGFGIEEGKTAMEAFLTMRDRPTALVCFNDMTAIGVLTAARTGGLRIPEELSVVGIDNIALADVVHPRLTSVDLDARRYGSSAVGLMVDVLEARQPRRHVVLEPTLVVRDSCQRPAGDAPPAL